MRTSIVLRPLIAPRLRSRSSSSSSRRSSSSISWSSRLADFPAFLVQVADLLILGVEQCVARGQPVRNVAISARARS